MTIDVALACLGGEGLRRVKWIGVVVVLVLITPIQPTVVLPGGVEGTAVAWAAGQSSPALDLPATNPPSTSFDLGTLSSITCSGIEGSAMCEMGPGNTPNVAEGQGGRTDSNGYGGISGIQFDGLRFFLMGVILGPSEASGSGPEKLVYSSSFSSSSAFNPLLGQAFFIGDAQGSAGQQTSNVPNGATRLFWGFGDGVGSRANPGGYGDNSGSVSLSKNFNSDSAVVPSPEPSSLILIGLGIGALTLLGRRSA